MHTVVRTWHNLEKQRGKIGMTWGIKVQRVAFSLVVVGALAMASGLAWIDGVSAIFAWIDSVL